MSPSPAAALCDSRVDTPTASRVSGPLRPRRHPCRSTATVSRTQQQQQLQLTPLECHATPSGDDHRRLQIRSQGRSIWQRRRVPSRRRPRHTTSSSNWIATHPIRPTTTSVTFTTSRPMARCGSWRPRAPSPGPASAAAAPKASKRKETSNRRRALGLLVQSLFDPQSNKVRFGNFDSSSSAEARQLDRDRRSHLDLRSRQLIAAPQIRVEALGRCMSKRGARKKVTTSLYTVS